MKLLFHFLFFHWQIFNEKIRGGSQEEHNSSGYSLLVGLEGRKVFLFFLFFFMFFFFFFFVFPSVWVSFPLFLLNFFYSLVSTIRFHRPELLKHIPGELIPLNPPINFSRMYSLSLSSLCNMFFFVHFFFLLLSPLSLSLSFLFVFFYLIFFVLS